MKILLNSTKTMDAAVTPPAGLRATKPAHRDRAAELIAGLRNLAPAVHRREMALSEKLAGTARADLLRWGEKKQPACPALFAFTGLVYKYIDAAGLDGAQLKQSQERLWILSGLYGLLRPLDRIEAYRLEMGSKWSPDKDSNLASWWREELTGAMNRRLKRGEPVINLAAQEYVKAVEVKALKGPLISPVFKEQRPDGSLKTAPVHAKMARGAMCGWLLRRAADSPAALLEFGELGWEAGCEPPESGPWLFTRPVRD